MPGRVYAGSINTRENPSYNIGEKRERGGTRRRQRGAVSQLQLRAGRPSSAGKSASIQPLASQLGGRHHTENIAVTTTFSFLEERKKYFLEEDQII